jgi:hypothetical protein
MPDKTNQRFHRLIEPHLDALFRAAYRLTRNRPDAEDLVQEACVRAFERLSWLLRVFDDAWQTLDPAQRAASAENVGQRSRTRHPHADCILASAIPQ